MQIAVTKIQMAKKYITKQLQFIYQRKLLKVRNQKQCAVPAECLEHRQLIC